jgi:hypothetical protein
MTMERETFEDPETIRWVEEKFRAGSLRRAGG